jgi:hypothetical protein
MGIVIVKIGEKKTHPHLCMESDNGLCWDHKQIENGYSIIWWHTLRSGGCILQLYLAPLAPYMHVFSKEPFWNKPNIILKQKNTQNNNSWFKNFSFSSYSSHLLE